MYTLTNEHLEVEVLDPVADRARMGARYCTGGYVFQVTDRRLGPLLSGPTYPTSFNTFDGQGIPDAFNRSPLRDPLNPRQALIPGIGLCDVSAGTVNQFSTWRVASGGQRITFETSHNLADFSLDVQRRVDLEGRTLLSTTRIRNSGTVGFGICWYPHPFFPQPGGDQLCRLSIPVRLAHSEAYEMGADGFIRRKGWPWTDDHFLALDHDAAAPLTVLQRHPKVGLVAATFSYVPRFFPIWGNRNTFSFEPYFENSIAAGQQIEWWVAYDF